MALTYLSSGSLSGYQDATPTHRVYIVKSTPVEQFDLFDTTGSGSTAKSFTTNNRIGHPISGIGIYQTTADSGSSYSNVHITGNMASLSGALFGPVHQLRVQKVFNLKDVTAATDVVPQKVYDNGGLSMTHGSMVASLETNDTFYEVNHNTSPATLVAPLGTGTLSGAVVVQRVSEDADFQGGGVPEAQYSFIYSGTVTETTNPLSLASWTATFNWANGDSGSATVKLATVDVLCDFRRGGLVYFTFSGQISGAIA